MQNKYSGFINLYKPVGISSARAMNIFKIKSGVKKCGYVGTLDPFADGVLLIAIEKETKNIEKMLNCEKTYLCEAVFGIGTDSMDCQGVVVEKIDFIPKIEEIKSSINNFFIGNIAQTPPIYSAVKVQGKRMCDIARNGKMEQDKMLETMQLKTKNITIYSFEVIEQKLPNVYIFEVKCGKGTYIRKLIYDLAKKLGSTAHLTKLTRTKVGEYNLISALKLEEITK